MASETIKYIGDGTTYFPGVSMQDMTKEEWYELPAATRAALVDNGLFNGPRPRDIPKPQAEETPVFEPEVLDAAIDAPAEESE